MVLKRDPILVAPRPGAVKLVAVRFAAALALLWALACGAMAEPSYPQLTGRIVDQAGMLDLATSGTLERKLSALEDKSGIQIVVATVPDLQGYDIETYANGLARQWKIGEAKKNNGLLLLVAKAERKVRIEVGYGLEGAMTDALSATIIRSVIAPRFKQGDFAGGIERGVDSIIGALSVDSAEWQRKSNVRVDQQASLIDAVLPFFILLLFIFIFISMMRNASRGGYAGRRGGVPPIIFLPGPSRRDDGWRGGGWSGGSGGGWGGGGGGFSGGGGDFGGGGASGDW